MNGKYITGNEDLHVEIKKAELSINAGLDTKTAYQLESIFEQNYEYTGEISLLSYPSDRGSNSGGEKVINLPDILLPPYVQDYIDEFNKELERRYNEKQLDNIAPYWKGKGTGQEKWTIAQPILDIADFLGNTLLESITFGKVGTDELGALALDMYKDKKGVYHARTSAWQQIGGYNDLYDMIFDIGTSMATVKFEFTDDDGRDYILWAWKGDYINLGAGAELGIYSRDSGFLGAVDVSTPHDDHWLVDTSLAMPMTMTLKEGNTVIANYTPSENQWWITSFNPEYKNRKASQLSVTYTVDFTGNEAMYNAFLKSDDYLRNKSMWSFLSEDNKYLMQLEF